MQFIQQGHVEERRMTHHQVCSTNRIRLHLSRCSHGLLWGPHPSLTATPQHHTAVLQSSDAENIFVLCDMQNDIKVWLDRPDV